ncbi:leucine-rich melanocyte differentiation-associated protein-like isoform X2 [Ischnura elegans]|nr:leucine-rich melanocyte differentiation-associated protein-like isoform X2 [Ischnura elegans]
MTSLGKLVFVDIHDGKGNKYVSEEDERLSLAYENLEDLPYNLIECFAGFVKTLDLSNNKFKNLDFLPRFSGLSAIILDHNEISENFVFPYLPSVTLLWLNHNKIAKLYPFIRKLRSSFPGLQYLSLMGNPAAPSYLNGGTFHEYLHYRLFVISWFPNLIHLDDCGVTAEQRMESKRLYQRSLFDSFSPSTSAVSVRVGDGASLMPSYLKALCSKLTGTFIGWDRKRMRPISSQDGDSSEETGKWNVVI